MSNLMLTLTIIFSILILAIAGMATGWLIKGKRKIPVDPHVHHNQSEKKKK